MAKESAKAQKGASKKAAAAKAEEKPVEKAHDDKGHHEATHATGHAPNRREYMVIFAVLAVLTAIEVGVAQIPGIGKGSLTVALVGLAVTKAAIVGLYYMHLKHETQIMKLTVALPMAFPVIYAVFLIADGAWRLAR